MLHEMYGKKTNYNIGKTKTMLQGYQAKALLENKGKHCLPFAPIYSLKHHLLIVALNSKILFQ